MGCRELRLIQLKNKTLACAVTVALAAAGYTAELGKGQVHSRAIREELTVEMRGWGGEREKERENYSVCKRPGRYITGLSRPG